MGSKLWLARERFIPSYRTSEEEIRQFSNYVIYMNEKKVAKRKYHSGDVMFAGHDYGLGSRFWGPIFKEAGISLEPGEGPVPIEITIRRLDNHEGVDNKQRQHDE